MKTYQIIVTLLVSLSFAMTAAWADTEGKCGDNVFWKFRTADSTLTLSGTGATYDYSFSPWPNNVYSVDDPNHVSENWSDSIRYVIVEDGITQLGDALFFSLFHLKKVTLAPSIQIIKSGTFNCCYELAEIVLSEQLIEIGKLAFNQCQALESIVFPNGLRSIQESAFSKSGLLEIIIPPSVDEIGIYAFNCPSLVKIKVEDGNLKYDSRDDSNALIETASNTLLAGSLNTVIPSSINKIGDFAYEGRKITSLTIPSSVKAIGKYAFCECEDLNMIKIPESVNIIGLGAFANCNKLSRIYVEWKAPISIEKNVFYGVALKCLVVPDGSIESYQKADVWKDFEQIVTATDIKEGALINDDSAKEIYRLDGTKVSGEQESLVPGTYIVQGEKILIK